MALSFKKAVKHQIKARVALDGPAGAGKTMSALKIATALVPGGRIAVIDSERASASRYANLFDFDVVELDSFNPRFYVEAIQAAVRDRYDVIIVDSLSHAWSGKDGALDQVDGKFGGWRAVTPLHNALVDALLTAPAHVFVTMRTKTEYLVTEKEQNGRTRQSVEKIGTKPIQREGTEYEFDVVGDLNLESVLSISKTRCPELKGRTFSCPGEDVARILRTWLDDGAAAPEPPMSTAEVANAAQRVAGAAGAADASMREAAQDASIQVAFDGASQAHEVGDVVRSLIEPLRLDRESPRRMRLLGMYAAAMDRIASATGVPFEETVRAAGSDAA